MNWKPQLELKMHHRHFAGDRLADSGYWGPPTSPANFCEEDYAFTPYIAEFISTISNLAYCYCAYLYARKGSWDLQATSLALVGVSSFAFHLTLTQAMQYGDDLSMLILAASFLIPVWTARIKSPSIRDLISGFVILAVAGAAMAYIRTGDMAFHSYAFATLTALGVPRTIHLLRTSRPHAGSQRQQGWRTVQSQRLLRAGSLVTVGFALWNADLEMCYELRALRERVGLPWAWGLELHGWWHILTAAGAYEYMKVVRAVTA